MISWTDEAIEAALDAFDAEEMRHRYPSTRKCLRAALDAAVKAQGLSDDLNDAHGVGYMQGRAEALEEAARVAETTAESDLAYGRRYPDEYHKMEQRAHRGRTIAAAIRALQEKQG